jgi:hypothetical protein
MSSAADPPNEDPGTAVRGALLALMAPDPGDEHDFADWYDHEHIPERLVLPGFVSTTRYLSTVRRADGRHNHLAVYELESVDALSTPGYLALRRDDRTERLTSAALDRQRVIATERAGTEPRPSASLLALTMAGADGPPDGHGLRRVRGWHASRRLIAIEPTAACAVVDLHYFEDELDEDAVRTHLADGALTFGELYRRTDSAPEPGADP